VNSISQSEKIVSSKAYLRYLLALFFLINVTSYMDRMVLSVLVEPIRVELGLSDTQIGLLTGFAFAVFYALMGFPIARLADRGSRRRIIAISLVLWSVMTALSGRAQNFTGLFLARVGVGVGEAGCFPTCNALIADLFPPKRRAMAMGIFMCGSTVGVILGFVIGGYLAEAYGWRTTFFLVGMPGVLVAMLVMFTMKETPSPATDTNKLDVPYRKLVKELLSSTNYCRLVLGASMGTFVTYGMAQWAPTFFIRSHGMSLSEVGTSFGLCYGGGSALGMILGGWAADKLQARNIVWISRVPAIAYMISFPLMAAAFYVDNSVLALTIITLGAIFGGAVTGPTLAAIQYITPEGGRATAAAILMLSTSLLGIGAAPFFVGVLSDLFSEAHGVESLRFSLIITSGIALAASYCFFSVKTLDPYRETSDQAGGLKSPS